MQIPIPFTNKVIEIETYKDKESPAIGIFLMKDLLENQWILTIALWKKGLTISLVKPCTP